VETKHEGNDDCDHDVRSQKVSRNGYVPWGQTTRYEPVTVHRASIAPLERERSQKNDIRGIAAKWSIYTGGTKKKVLGSSIEKGQFWGAPPNFVGKEFQRDNQVGKDELYGRYEEREKGSYNLRRINWVPGGGGPPEGNSKIKGQTVLLEREEGWGKILQDTYRGWGEPETVKVLGGRSQGRLEQGIKKEKKKLDSESPSCNYAKRINDGGGERQQVRAFVCAGARNSILRRLKDKGQISSSPTDTREVGESAIGSGRTIVEERSRIRNLLRPEQ